MHLCRIHSRSTVQTTTRKHNEVFSVASSSPFGPVLYFQSSPSLSIKVGELSKNIMAWQMEAFSNIMNRK